MAPEIPTRFFETPDLCMIDGDITLMGRCGYPHSLTAMVPDISPYFPQDYLQFSIRSRLAQMGLSLSAYRRVGAKSWSIDVTNVGPRDIRLDNGSALGSLFFPSKSVSGRDLLHTVADHIETFDNPVVFADKTGRPIDTTIEHQLSRAQLLGIPLNTDEFYQVKQAPEPIRVTPDGHERTAVASYLEEVGDVSNSPFIVGSTIPVSVNGVRLTLLPHYYDPLYHLHALLIRQGSVWSEKNGHDSGIRVELLSMENRPISRNDLQEYAPYIYFAVHQE